MSANDAADKGFVSKIHRRLPQFNISTCCDSHLTQRAAHMPVSLLRAVTEVRCRRELTGTVRPHSAARRASLNGTEPNPRRFELFHCAPIHTSAFSPFKACILIICRSIMAGCRPWNLSMFMLEWNHAHLSRTSLSFSLCLLQFFFLKWK